MKFKCTNCGNIFYSERPLKKCDSCNGELKQVGGKGETIYCKKSNGETSLINGMPSCDYYKMENAQGQRCQFSENPSSCKYSKLSDYTPRVGIVSR